MIPLLLILAGGRGTPPMVHSMRSLHEGSDVQSRAGFPFGRKRAARTVLSRRIRLGVEGLEDRRVLTAAGTSHSWSNPNPITYGTALGSTQLDTTATYDGSSVPGSFGYTPAWGTVMNAGPHQSLSVEFIPTDTTDHADASASVDINDAGVRMVLEESSSWAMSGSRTSGANASRL